MLHLPALNATQLKDTLMSWCKSEKPFTAYVSCKSLVNLFAHCMTLIKSSAFVRQSFRCKKETILSADALKDRLLKWIAKSSKLPLVTWSVQNAKQGTKLLQTQDQYFAYPTMSLHKVQTVSSSDTSLDLPLNFSANRVIRQLAMYSLPSLEAQKAVLAV
jgi:hypothetical protein